MKDPSKLRMLVQQLQDGEHGKLEGGFVLLLGHIDAAVIIGGEETNNCNGGNCASGCGLNTATGCGGQVNKVAGCGTGNQIQAAFSSSY